MLDTLLDEGWSYHDTESRRLAQELEAAAGDADDGKLDAFLFLSNHTIGEHLRDWPRARRLAERLMEGRAASEGAARAWARLAVARLMAGDATGAVAAELAGAAAAAEPLAAIIDARFLLVAALVGSGRAREAIGIYETGLDLARRLGPAAPHRAIAVASNNLGYDLVEAPVRSADDDAVMRLAASAGLEFWRACGTWRHEEKALILTARVALLRGEPGAALADAEAALAIIAANEAEPADTAIAHVVRAVALGQTGDSGGQAREMAIAETAVAAADDDGKAFYADQRDWILGERRAG